MFLGMGAKTIFLIFNIAVILLSASISQSAFADGTIDQNNLGETPAGAFPLPSPVEDDRPRISQSFTPTVPRLDAVEIEIEISDLSLTREQPIRVDIRDPSGELTSQPGKAILPANEDCMKSCVIHIDLDNPILLKTGVLHILEIIPTNSGMGWFLAKDPNPYPGGALIILNMPQPVDLIFATLFLQPGTTPVFDVPPTPAAGTSFITGVGGTVTFDVQCSDADAGDTVTMMGLSLPAEQLEHLAGHQQLLAQLL